MLTGVPCHLLHIQHDANVSQHTSSSTSMLAVASSVLYPLSLSTSVLDRGPPVPGAYRQGGQ